MEGTASVKHIFISKTSSFAAENELLISAVAANDAVAVAAILAAFSDAILWLNPMKNLSILIEACSLNHEATALTILAHLESRQDAQCAADLMTE